MNAPTAVNGNTANMEATASSGEDLQTQLSTLLASATQQYSLKNYPAAAEIYSTAAEIQDQINGEMSPENADLLYQYGRCLYHVAVSNSDVLGGKVVGGEEPKRKKRKTTKTNGEANSSVIGEALKEGEQKLAEEVVEAAVEAQDGMKKEDESATAKPYFQITGDENWTDSEEEDEDGEAAADAEAEEEEDDFAIAYEILDVARVLLTRKLEQEDLSQEQQRQIRERLADTHDLQAEISLENERFHDAIKDTRDALALKVQLYPEESSLIAEAHFKLSLALEFASVTSTGDDTNGASETTAQVDESMRHEAAAEMELAIASCNSRIAKERAMLPTLTDAAKKAEQERSIADVKEMVADMQQRLVDLRNPAVSLSGLDAQPAGVDGGADPLRGILGDMLGESQGEKKRRIEAATAGANDLSGLVKKKKVKVEQANGDGAVTEGKVKRKAEDIADDGDDASKRTKLESKMTA